MGIVEVVGRYLEENRRLVVPGFGAFVVKESGELLFSEMLQTDDGVLRALLAAEGLSEMECAAMIDRFIFEVRNELSNYGYCRLGDVGTLRRLPESGALKLMPPPPAAPRVAPPATQPRVAVTPPAAPPAPQPAAPAAVPPVGQSRPVPRRSAPQKRGVDKFVMAIAVAVLLLAAAAIAYGWYSNRQVNIEQDDMAMDALRIELGASSSQQ